MFAAGEAFRYAATGNQTAMKNVAKLYDGCELLLNLTRRWLSNVVIFYISKDIKSDIRRSFESVPGLLSRSVATTQVTADRWVLYNQTSNITCEQCEGLYWKNDISQGLNCRYFYKSMIHGPWIWFFFQKWFLKFIKIQLLAICSFCQFSLNLELIFLGLKGKQFKTF